MALWGVWFLLAMVSFAIYEAYAIFTRKVPTLSRTVWRISARYPMFRFLMGGVVGGLAVHSFGWIPACIP